jgi:hypothetical protein
MLDECIPDHVPPRRQLDSPEEKHEKEKLRQDFG